MILIDFHNNFNIIRIEVRQEILSIIQIPNLTLTPIYRISNWYTIDYTPNEYFSFSEKEARLGPWCQGGWRRV